ncbi:VOC family protein [Arenibacter sp. BSSL-BM3]|uniref:VOC family protein n=1 Tax=Arenibacter arenosicollis TaxID=2762274 RepID=A0ABR7QTQ4_9FLAO|nr:VOC family protein [Arenibacter arenosicollis]MBC8770585.1 VOC family protein [Arenibacter arenosicollis]
MLKNSKAFSGFSVNDINKAKIFYRQTLGLKLRDIPMGMLELDLKGNHPIVIYPKYDHVPATFTILNFLVEDIEVAVAALSKKGIVFEQYKDLNTDEKGIAHNDGPLIAWFKDPAGNILSLIQEE